MGLGDHIERALSLVGVTPDLVESWVGRPCGCQERKDKLNALGHWAGRVLRGRVGQAREYLLQVMNHDIRPVSEHEEGG